MIEDSDAIVGRDSRMARRPLKQGRIVLFGIEPTSPATGYGYIRRGGAVDGAVYEVAEFVEKPDQATAAHYLATGSYLWNSGIFLLGARQLLAELERYSPGWCMLPAPHLSTVNATSISCGSSSDDFGRSPSISLDHAVMEQTDRAAVIPLRCGWTDLGAWSALWDIGAHDADGNVIAGEAVPEKSHNCYLRGEGPLVAAVGVEDLVVVATDDVVLVARRDCDQDVKELVARLKKEGRTAAVASRRVHRPWGFYESIQQGHRYQVKRISVNPGAKLSLQRHYHRAEHWVVVNGTALVTRDNERHARARE